jgi:DNA-binding Lrp family transcriptional regulator
VSSDASSEKPSVTDTTAFAIRESRMYNRNVAVLKPQDLAVVLYLCRPSPSRPPYAQIAAELSTSPSEVHAAVVRAVASGLLHGTELGHRPNLSALEEFLLHGMKYAFPAERGEPTRGVPTSYAAAPLSALIAPSNDLPPVWPYPSGKVRGTAFQPLYRGAPKAALRDPLLYEYLALVDALRDGRARERKLAEELIISRLRPAVHA